MTFLIKGIFALVLVGFGGNVFASTEDAYEVVPFKFDKAVSTDFVIPPQIRHTMPRYVEGEPDLVYYFSKPKNTSKYPIAIVCGGSYERTRIYSVFHIYRYFFKEFMDLGLGIVSAEEWGIDGHNIDVDLFMEHYTRTRRFDDHKILMDYFIAHPPAGWDGKFVLFGISEGAQLVTRLTEEYQKHLIATISWAGSSGLDWRDEQWLSVEYMRRNFSFWERCVDKVAQWIPCIPHIPATRKEYDELMDYIEKNPVTNKEFLEMTYLYHADGFHYPLPEYKKLTVPFLDAVGGLDSVIEAFDVFAKRAQEAGCPITYVRVDDMNHFVRKCPYIVSKTFDWLERQLAHHSAGFTY